MIWGTNHIINIYLYHLYNVGIINKGYAWCKKPKKQGNFFLKKPKICSTVKRLLGLLIKQPEEQEVAQDDIAPVLHLLLWLV